MSDQCSSICPNRANVPPLTTKMNKPKLKYFMHFPYLNSTSNLFLDIDDKKKHPKIQIHQTLASQTYHQLKNAQGHYASPPVRPNQTAHLRGTQHQRAHFTAHLGNMPQPPSSSSKRTMYSINKQRPRFKVPVTY